MRKARIGILHTSKGEMDDALQIIYPFGYPTSILPGECVQVDALIIPDGIGAVPTMPCFITCAYEAAIAVSKKPICGMAEIFRVSTRGLDYYIDKGIPIIGVGDGRVMLWNYLNGKIDIIRNEFKLRNDQKVSSLQSDYLEEFERDQFVGVSTIYSPLLKATLREMQEKEQRMWEKNKESLLRTTDEEDIYLQ